MAGYNHYTPQSDGSYRRSTVPESARRSGTRPPYQAQQPSQPRPEPPKPPKQEHPAPCEPPEPPKPPEQPCHSGPESGQGILSFLRGLLPRQLDAADLLVIALLLLLERDEEKQDDLSPLLTIALYFLL